MAALPRAIRGRGAWGNMPAEFAASLQNESENRTAVAKAAKIEPR
jgi:hypothetical protein